MKMTLKSDKLLLIFVLLFNFSSQASDLEWLARVPFSVRTQALMLDIKERDFFEISLSKFDAAENKLNSVSFAMVGNEAIDFFGGRGFRCADGNQAYLVRAIYENGASGKYYVRRYGNSLQIAHGSMGAASEEKRSALIVCLDFEPGNVYGETGGAM